GAAEQRSESHAAEPEQLLAKAWLLIEDSRGAHAAGVEQRLQELLHERELGLVLQPSEAQRCAYLLLLPPQQGLLRKHVVVVHGLRGTQRVPAREARPGILGHGEVALEDGLVGVN